MVIDPKNRNIFLQKVSVNNEDRENLERALMVLERFRFYNKNYIPFGILIESETEEDTMEFLQLLETYMDQELPEKQYVLMHSTEQRLSGFHLKNKLRTPRQIFVLTDCMEEGSTERILSEFLETLEIIKIVAASPVAVRNRFQKEGDLLETLLPVHIRLKKPDARDISERFLTLFKMDYETTEEFDRELSYYCDTIFDAQRHSGNEFISDLYARVERRMCKGKGIDAYRNGEKADSSLIPASDRVAARKQREQAVVSYVEPRRNKGNSTRLPDFIPLEISENNEGNTAVLLLFPSECKERSEERTYLAPNGKLYQALFPDDAALQYLIDQAHADGACRFVFLCMEDSEEYGFKERLTEFVFGYTNGHAEVKTVSSDFSDCGNQMCQLKKLVKEYPRPVFYVKESADAGKKGLLADTILKFMKLSGVNCGKSAFADSETQNVREEDPVFRVNQILSGTENFLKTGNAVFLTELFQNRGSLSGEMKQILDCVQNFSDAIQLSDAKDALNALTQLRAVLDRLPEETEDADTGVIASVKDSLKEQLGFKINDADDNKEKAEIKSGLTNGSPENETLRSEDLIAESVVETTVESEKIIEINIRKRLEEVFDLRAEDELENSDSRSEVTKEWGEAPSLEEEKEKVKEDEVLDLGPMTYKDIDVELGTIPDVNIDQLKTLIQMVLMEFKCRPGLKNQTEWLTMSELLKNRYGKKDVPTRKTINLNFTKTGTRKLLEMKNYLITEGQDNDGNFIIRVAR